MSSIAKVFIVVNLLLSALVLGWASTHLGTVKNWKEENGKLQTTLDTTVEEKDGEISGLLGNMGDLEASRDTVRSEKEQAVAMRDRNASDLAAKTEEANTLRSRLDSIDSTLGTYAETNDNLQARFEQAANERSAAEEARREAEDAMEEAQAAQVAAQTALDAANNTIAKLNTEKTDLMQSLKDTETQVAILVERTGTAVEDLIIQPNIDGAVLAVNNSLTPGLVAINKGSNDDVKRGFTFQVFSGGTYKGKVRVETVQENMCTATIVSTYNGAQIIQGDRASTKL